MNELHITEVGFVRARPKEVETGMLGYVAFVLNDVVKIDGVALRRTRRGNPALSFPFRRDRQGREHPYIRPLSDEARRRLERMVFDALGIGEEAR